MSAKAFVLMQHDHVSITRRSCNEHIVEGDGNTPASQSECVQRGGIPGGVVNGGPIQDCKLLPHFLVLGFVADSSQHLEHDDTYRGGLALVEQFVHSRDETAWSAAP